MTGPPWTIQVAHHNPGLLPENRRAALANLPTCKMYVLLRQETGRRVSIQYESIIDLLSKTLEKTSLNRLGNRFAVFSSGR